MRKITQKQIKLLKILDERTRIVATWANQDLIDLRRMRLVDYEPAYNATGKLSGNAIWSINDSGRRFLADERAGQ